MLAQGERAGGLVFVCTGSYAPLSMRQRMCLHTSAEGEPHTQALRASPVHGHCARGGRYVQPGGRSPSRAQQGMCPRARLSFAGASALGHAVMVGEKRLA